MIRRFIGVNLAHPWYWTYTWCVDTVAGKAWAEYPNGVKTTPTSFCAIVSPAWIEDKSCGGLFDCELPEIRRLTSRRACGRV